MAVGKFVSYLRVSTERQGKSGLGLEAQRAAVADYLNGGTWTLLREYVEVESGKRADRPALAEALKLCKLTGATLVVAKLDRLARNVAFVSALMESGVPFVAADMPAANNLTIHIIAAVAEDEAKRISARTKAALAAAKARGQKLGGFRGAMPPPAEVATAARRKAADAFAANVGPVAREMRDQGQSLRQIAAELASCGIRTPRDGAWTAAAVRAVLTREPGSAA